MVVIVLALAICITLVLALAGVLTGSGWCMVALARSGAGWPA
jgi:hypothetical protein